MRVASVTHWPLVDLGLQAVFQNEADIDFVGSFDSLDRLEATLSSEAGADETPFVLIGNAGEAWIDPQQIDRLRQQCGLRVILLIPADAREAVMLRALRSGSDGFLTFSAAQDMVAAAVRTVVQGQSWLDPQIATVVIDQLRRPVLSLQEADTVPDLSDRERALLQLGADGLSNVQIADTLGLAEKTVRNLWSGLFEKIGMVDRTQAVLWALRTGQAILRDSLEQPDFL